MVALTADILDDPTFLTAATVGVPEKLSNLLNGLRDHLLSLDKALAAIGVGGAPLATATKQPSQPLTALRPQAKRATKQPGFNI